MIAAICGASSAWAREIGADEDLSQLTLVRSAQGKAVVRFGTGPLVMVSVGDRLGRHQAEVKEIEAGRLVLEESFTGGDGNPNVALIILKDGEKGGKRYLLHPEGRPPPTTHPKVIFPEEREKKQ